MAKRKRTRSFTDLNFSKQDLASNNHKVVAKMGYNLLLRVKPRTAINAVWSLKILAKAQGIKSVAKVVGFRTKTARSFPKKLGGKRYTNGRTFKKYSKKPRRLIKGTPEAKRYMAKIRAMR